MANCIPDTVLLEPSVYDDKVLENLARSSTDLLSVKYQAAWPEVFTVLQAMFDALRWRADPIMSDVVRTVGELRGNESFTGRKEADQVLSRAVNAMGPRSVLALLPLNLAKPRAGEAGRAWMLPILRDSVSNTSLSHFRSDFVPLSEAMFQRVIDNGPAEKTMEIKIFETLVQQIWALLPGYCDLPTDLTEVMHIDSSRIPLTRASSLSIRASPSSFPTFSTNRSTYEQTSAERCRPLSSPTRLS